MNSREYEISENIKKVKERINIACEKAGRSSDEISLVCVTKNFPASDIEYAVNCGIDIAGENRVQELMEKYDQVFPKQWHLIGHLQKNKVKYIAGKVELIHSVDSTELLNEIQKQAKKADVVQKILIQVNTSGEESKFGCAPEETDSLLKVASGLENVKVKGIMTIAPIYVNNVTPRLHFDNTRKLYIDIKANKYDNIDMDILSMGMSSDFEDAILAGANMIRVGSAIFGKRNYQ